MLCRRIELHGFMRHDRAVVELPARGVVLVTGDNGAGKSSLVESVAWALWGRTLRGANPWRGGQGAPICVVAVDGPAVQVRRERGGRRSTLAWNRPGDAPAEYETATKAQAALDAVVGTFDMWRRTHVFTSADAWAFTSATDAQRKVMLEALLGLDMFDIALERCRTDLRDAVVTAQRAENDIARIRGALQTAQGQAASLRGAQPGDAGDIDAVNRELRRLDAALEAAAIDSEALSSAQRAAEADAAAVSRAQAEARRVVAGVDRPTCDACGQQVQPEHADRVRAEQRAKIAAAVEAAKDANDRLRAVAAERTAHDADVQRMRARRDALLRQQATHAAAQRQRDTWAGLLRDADAQVAKLTAEEADAAARVADLRARVADLRTAEQVLGLRGVRAQVLDGALYAVQQVANVWLTRFAGEGVELKLHSRTALKGGGTADTIAVEVVGFGDVEGYAGASAGERRRVDVALMLALAEVMRARAGAEAGTLWFDEVFDVLDATGVDAVCAALREVAAERPVVVVTHHAELAARLGADLHLHVIDGRITRR